MVHSLRYFSMPLLSSKIRAVVGLLFLVLGSSLAVGQVDASSAPPIDARRVVAAVRQMDASPTNSVAAATEAFLAAGFSIWDGDRKPLKEPTVERSGLAVTPGEIKTFVELREEGVAIKLGDLLNAIDYIWTHVGGEGFIREDVREWLRYSPVDPDTSKRGIGFLLNTLAASHDDIKDTYWRDDSTIDALQQFIILRVITEDLGAPIREKLKARITPGVQAPILEGWSEDGYVGSVGLGLGMILGKLEDFTKSVSIANFVASVTKFIATYKFLKMKFEVEAPGQPLVRTKTTSPGEQRTLVTKVYFDGEIFADWLKENRTTIVLAIPGLDLDAPKSGPIAGVETAWDFDQDRKYASKQLIQVIGRQDISKVVTDADGNARVRVEGKPQTTNFDPKKVRAVEKTIKVSVTAQVKSTSAQQDIVDAIMGAIGVKDGPGLGVLTPIMETLYRCKWNGTRVYKLRIRDWVPAETVGKLVLEIRGDGFDGRRDGAAFASIDSSLTTGEFEMSSFGGADAEKVDLPASVLNQMTAAEREEYKKMLEDMQKETFFASGTGIVDLKLRSSITKRGVFADCDEETIEEKELVVGASRWEHPKERSEKQGFDWQVVIDRKTNEAIVRVSATCMVTTERTRRSSRSENNLNEKKETFGYLAPGMVFPAELRVPLKVRDIPAEGMLDFYGTTSIPFKFGPNQKFTGSILVSFSIQKKVAKPK